MLPITLTMAGAAVLLNLWLGFRIGRIRHSTGISVGDGGNLALTARMRAQSNFIENAPLFLILLGAIELARGQQQWLWIASIVFILGRILHALGMDKPSPSRLRLIGIVTSSAALIALAIYAVSIPYLTPAPTSSIGIAAVG
jgi:uncharacterized membrane protein YecN with MAPEG domain